MNDRLNRPDQARDRGPLSWFMPPLFLLLGIMLAGGCDDRGFAPIPRMDIAGSAAAKEQPAPAPVASRQEEPTLLVGNLSVPLPVPGGFRRIPADHPLMRTTQASLGSEEILLAIFERAGEAGAEGGRPEERELLLVSTLHKWLHMNISTADFLTLKQPWQEESVLFNQNVLHYFEEAVETRLHDKRHFVYNLGLFDSSPLHISFLKVIKDGGPAKNPYVCSTNSLLWHHGKILRISHRSPLGNFNQIPAVAADSVNYLRKLHNLGLSLEHSERSPSALVAETGATKTN